MIGGEGGRRGRLVLAFLSGRLSRTLLPQPGKCYALQAQVLVHALPGARLHRLRTRTLSGRSGSTARYREAPEQCRANHGRHCPLKQAPRANHVAAWQSLQVQPQRYRYRYFGRCRCGVSTCRPNACTVPGQVPLWNTHTLTSNHHLAASMATLPALTFSSFLFFFSPSLYSSPPPL